MKKLLFILSACFSLSFSAYPQEATSQISGKITGADGTPLAGASIALQNIQAGAISNIDGVYLIKGLKNGSYTVKYSFLGYESQVREVELNSNIVINISLLPSSHVTGEVFVNATRAGENMPLAYSVIGRKELTKLGAAQDLPYLLGLTPSLVETSEAGNGVGYTSLRIRGTDANRINVTIDGIPLNDPESQQVFWVDLPDLSSSVDNIQIQRGAGTSSNGAGAFGATLSIQTLSPWNQAGAETSTVYGSFNTLKNTITAGTGLLNNRFAFQMRYSDIKSDGYIDRTGSNHRSAFLTGMYRGEKSSLKANFILGEEHTGIGWWGVPKDSLATNRTYNPAGEYTDQNGRMTHYGNESDNYKQDHFQLIYNIQPGENLGINAAFHYTKGKGYYEEYRENENLIDYKIPTFTIGNQVISSSNLIRRKWMDNDFYGIVYSMVYKKNRTELVFGGGVNRYLGNHFGRIIWMRDAGPAEKDYQWYLNNSVKDEASFYGKLNYKASEKLNLFGDMQYRFINYKLAGIDDDLKNLAQQHRFGFFNPKAGIFFNIDDKQESWLSFSVAHREPTRSDFKEATGDQAATPRPETLYDAETGYKLHGQRGSLSLNLYGMFYKDQLVPTGQLSDVGYSIMTNVDNSFRIGVELTGSLRLTNFINWNSSLTLSRNKINNFVEYYTEYNTSDWSSQYLNKDLGQVDIAYSPSQVWTNDLGFEEGILGLHLISKYVGKQYFDNTMSDERKIDPYFVNNLRLDITPVIRNMKNTTIQLYVNNIFDAKYENNAYGGNWFEDGKEMTWSYYFPQAGINYMLRLALKF